MLCIFQCNLLPVIGLLAMHVDALLHETMQGLSA